MTRNANTRAERTGLCLQRLGAYNFRSAIVLAVNNAMTTNFAGIYLSEEKAGVKKNRV
jgi:hypothetical protein